MLYVAITIGLLVAVLGVAALPTFENWRGRFATFFNAVVTITATFIGVFAALYLSNLDERQRDRDQAAALIDAVTGDIDRAGRHLATFYQGHQDSSPLSKSTAKLLQGTPLSFPTSLRQLLGSDLVLRNLSGESFIHLSEAADFIGRLHRASHAESMPNSYIVQRLRDYGSWLYYAKSVLRAEAMHLRGRIRVSELAELHRRALVEALGFSKRDVDKVLQSLGPTFQEHVQWEKDFTYE